MYMLRVSAVRCGGVTNANCSSVSARTSPNFLWWPVAAPRCSYAMSGNPVTGLMGFAVRVRSAGQKYGQRATKGTVLTSQSLSPWCDCRRSGSTLASWRCQGINVGNPLWRRALLGLFIKLSRSHPPRWILNAWCQSAGSVNSPKSILSRACSSTAGQTV